jgi:hypothetical protein
LGSKEQACIHRLSVEQHGTCPTFPDTASLFGSGEAEFVPEKIEKGTIRGHIVLQFISVQYKPNGNLFR